MPDYKPYGEEWKQAMMKHTKREIVDILGEEIQKLKAEIERKQDDGADAKWN